MENVQGSFKNTDPFGLAPEMSFFFLGSTAPLELNAFIYLFMLKFNVRHATEMTFLSIFQF